MSFAKEINKAKWNCWPGEFPSGVLDTEVPERLFEHILHGFEVGAEKTSAFGADFFYTGNFGDPSRIPSTFLGKKCRKHNPSILDSLEIDLTEKQLKGLAFENAL